MHRTILVQDYLLPRLLLLADTRWQVRVVKELPEQTLCSDRQRLGPNLPWRPLLHCRGESLNTSHLSSLHLAQQHCRVFSVNELLGFQIEESSLRRRHFLGVMPHYWELHASRFLCGDVWSNNTRNYNDQNFWAVQQSEGSLASILSIGVPNHQLQLLIFPLSLHDLLARRSFLSSARYFLSGRVAVKQTSIRCLACLPQDFGALISFVLKLFESDRLKQPSAARPKRCHVRNKKSARINKTDAHWLLQTSLP